MKPVKLVMSAFGPFADEVTIDFQRLGDAGLYLVTGDTGAGKTTIFDAISYALYGTTSGEFREGKMLRSKYASLDVLTFVELTFETHGKCYVVKRTPDQIRARMRGEGETKQSAEAILFYPDDRQPITKIPDVNKAVKEVVGLDQKQFSQITMLAQGEFRKMLLSSTDEKQKIFRDIFATWDYESLQERLKEQSLERKRKYDKQRDNILHDITSLECGEEFAGKDVLEQFKTSGQLVGKDAFKNQIDDLLKMDKELLEKYQRQLLKLENELQQLNSRIGVASERQRSVQELQRIEVELVNLKEALIEKENIRKKAEQDAKCIDQLHAETVRIEMRLDDYNQYTALKDAIIEKQCIMQVIERQQEERKATMEKNVRNERHLKEIVERYKGVDVRILELEQKLTAANERKTEMEFLVQDYEKEQKLQLVLEQKQNAYKDKSMEFERMAKGLAEHEKLFLDAQAGVLAEMLEEGKACPVCGSVNHPHPAAKIAEVATREQLDEEKNQVDAVRKQCQDASVAVVQAREQLEQQKNRCMEKLEKLFNVTDIQRKELDIECARMAEQIVDMELNLKQWQVAKEEYDRASSELPKLTEDAKRLQEAFQSAEQDKVAGHTEVKKLSEQLERVKEGLQFDSIDDAHKEIERLREKAKTLADAQKTATDVLQKLKQKISAQAGQKRSLEKLLDAQPVEDLSELEEQRNHFMRDKQAKEMLNSRVNARYQKNQSIVNRINQAWFEFERYEQEYLAVKTLSDTANGELSGRDKIKLETYIQMAYFERVLEKANVRLLGMTGGQYELIRSKQADNQKSQSGLEINVFDHYTSSERSVKSLSGGETFMASLALALGLADEIQAMVGGIHIDTLFVDEGFGSLDDETLKRAMKELNKLTEGNRLVGIISHVADLKSWIDKQIVVTKVNHEGSHVELIV